ncbi:hypothetical protein ACFLT5_00030 [Chloroflexota bacterium]
MTESATTIHFSADRTLIRPGECATLRWRVEGVKEVYFFAEGQRWRRHGVVGVGEREVCPSQTTAYRLRVIKRDGSKEVRKIEVQVQAQLGSQVVQTFAVDRVEIHPGECATFRWRVEGVKAVYFYPKGEQWEDHGVVGAGEQQVCPSQTTTYCLRVIKRDGSKEVHKIEVQVQAQLGSQVVQMFAVDRLEIRPGECVTFRWRVGGVKAVYLHPEGQRWQDHGVVGEGEQQVCPSQTTTHCLRVIKADDSLENHYITIQVRG